MVHSAPFTSLSLDKEESVERLRKGREQGQGGVQGQGEGAKKGGLVCGCWSQRTAPGPSGPHFGPVPPTNWLSLPRGGGWGGVSKGAVGVSEAARGP